MRRDETQIPAGHFDCYEQHGSLSDGLLAPLAHFARRRHKAIWPLRRRSVVPSAAVPEAERGALTQQLCTRELTCTKKG